MGPRLRRLALSVHIVTSVGWLGAVAAFLALASVGASSGEAGTVRACYVAMQLIGWYVIVPMSGASLASGLVQSLGTPWGLLRHYWVLVKLIITVAASFLLVVHMELVSQAADEAALGAAAGSDVVGVRMQLLADAGAAFVVLAVAVGLSVYKPRGMTRYGWRRRRMREAPQP